MTSTPPSESLDQEQPLVSHLIELRDRVVRMVVVVLVVLLALFPFANDLYTAVAGPLRAALPAGSSMISTRPIDPFLVPLKLSLQLAIFIAVPFILYQMWAFVAPGLYRHEKRLVVPLLISSTLLFYLGMAFAYFAVFPLVFGYLAQTPPEGVEVATDMGSYLDFVMTLFFAFGAAFEVPIATIILVWMGITTPASLRQKRPYVIVGVFVAGMLLTPPDVISQTLLALPMWILFELGIVFSQGFVRAPPGEAESAAGVASGVSVPVSPAPAGGSMGEGPDKPGEEGDRDRFVPLSEAEMEAELDAIEAQEARHAAERPSAEAVEEMLQRIQSLRRDGAVSEARDLLYEVLQWGDEDQRRVARNILVQLDSDP